MLGRPSQMREVADPSEVNPPSGEKHRLGNYIWPEQVQLPLKPMYEDTIQESSAQSERERLSRKAQINMKR